jgi:hypothetical protein
MSCVPKLPKITKPTKKQAKQGKKVARQIRKKATKKAAKKEKKTMLKSFAKRTAKDIKKQAKKGNVVVSGNKEGKTISTIKRFSKGGSVTSTTKKKPSGGRTTKPIVPKVRPAPSRSLPRPSKTRTLDKRTRPPATKKPKPKPTRVVGGGRVKKMEKGGTVKKKTAGADKRVKPKQINRERLKALGPVGGAAEIAVNPQSDIAKDFKVLGPVGGAVQLMTGKTQAERGKAYKEAQRRKQLSTRMPKEGVGFPKKPSLIDKAAGAVLDFQMGRRAAKDSAARASKGIIRTPNDLRQLERDRQAKLYNLRLSGGGSPSSQSLAMRRALSKPVTPQNAQAIFAALKGKPPPTASIAKKTKPKTKPKKTS